MQPRRPSTKPADDEGIPGSMDDAYHDISWSRANVTAEHGDSDYHSATQAFALDGTEPNNRILSACVQNNMVELS